MVSQNFGGKHAVPVFENPHIFEWNLNYSAANRYEPDLKQQVWNRNLLATEFNLPDRIGNNPDGSRYFSDAEDIVREFNAAYEFPFSQWSGLRSKFKLGGSAIDREKNFESRTFVLRNNNPGTGAEIYPVPGDITFHPIRIWNEDYLFEQRTQDFSDYDAIQKVHAYFGQLDMPLMVGLRFTGGLRYEDSLQYIKTFNPYDRSGIIPEYAVDRPGLGEVRTKDKLPSANVIWEFHRDMNLRLAYAETITRPDFRELSEFGFSPYFLADRIFGNPELNRTYIHNYDVRWEWYMSELNYLGLGVFIKNLSDPIEMIGQPASGAAAINYTYANAERAEIRGIEVEFRQDFLSRFRGEVNFFWIDSEVTVMDWIEKYSIDSGLVDLRDRRALYSPTNISRPLQGQSDYVYNIRLYYFFNEANSTSLGLFYNVYGDRIYSVGAFGAPDTIEKSAGVLDLVFEHSPSDAIDFKIAAKNVLDTRFKVTIEDNLFGVERLYRSYRKGVDYSASMTYRF